MRSADGFDAVERWLLIQQRTTTAIHLKVDETGCDEFSIDVNSVITVGDAIPRGNILHDTVRDQQSSIIVIGIAVENGLTAIGEGVAHRVTVTFFKATGLSGLKPRARESFSTKP